MSVKVQKHVVCSSQEYIKYGRPFKFMFSLITFEFTRTVEIYSLVFRPLSAFFTREPMHDRKYILYIYAMLTYYIL